MTLLVPEDGVFGTHQILLTAGSREDAARNIAELQNSGITTSLCAVPGRCDSWAIRLGTQLVTRRGMGIDEMHRIAYMIAAVLRSTRSISLRDEVTKLTDPFRTLLFCGETAQNDGAHLCANES